MRSMGAASLCWRCLKDSRIILRARLRTWALPIRRLVMTPSREVAPDSVSRQLAIKQPLTLL